MGTIGEDSGTVSWFIVERNPPFRSTENHIKLGTVPRPLPHRNPSTMQCLPRLCIQLRFAGDPQSPHLYNACSTIRIRKTLPLRMVPEVHMTTVRTADSSNTPGRNDKCVARHEFLQKEFQLQKSHARLGEAQCPGFYAVPRSPSLSATLSGPEPYFRSICCSVSSSLTIHHPAMIRPGT